MTLIVYHLHEQKLEADSGVIDWQSTDINQCNTPAALSKAYLEEPGHMPSLDQQNMQRHPLHIPMISHKLALELTKISNLFCITQ